MADDQYLVPKLIPVQSILISSPPSQPKSTPSANTRWHHNLSHKFICSKSLKWLRF